MPEALSTLAVLACAIGMGLMMWFMMRGKKSERAGSPQATESDARVAQLRAELDQVRAELRDQRTEPRTRAD